jgi:hypothetical protein
LREENQGNLRAEIQSRALWVQLGAKGLVGCKLGLPNRGEAALALENHLKERNKWVNLVYHVCFSLNMTCGSGPREPGSPELQYISHYVPFADSGSHRDSNTALLPCCCSSSAGTIFFNKIQPKMENGSNGNDKLQIIYR